MAADEQQPGARILSQRDLFAGRVFKVRQEVTVLPNGRQTTFDLIRHPGAAAIVPLDTDGNVVLVRQYRHAAGTWLLEVPAGTLGEGEAPEACAFRRQVHAATDAGAHGARGGIARQGCRPPDCGAAARR